MYQNTPQISTYYSHVSTCLICVHLWNGNAVTVEPEEEKPVLSIEEYRKLLNDQKTSDEIIRERIDFLVRYTRKIIKMELKNVCQKQK